MQKLRLSIAMGDYDRTRPIVDGRVPFDGVEPVCMLQSPEEMFFRAFRHQAYDVSELSLSSYCVSVAIGDPAYVAVPAFLSRAFRHSSIYIRTDRGIGGLADLRGRRIGIAEYQLTANVWARALMAGRFAVAQGDLESLVLPVLRHRVLVNFKGEAEGVTSEDVARGILAAVGSPRSPLE